LGGQGQNNCERAAANIHHCGRSFAASAVRSCSIVGGSYPLHFAGRLVAEFVAHYSHACPHSAISYVTPADNFAGRGAAFAKRDQKVAHVSLT
jgi:hypothetical protein